MMQSYLIFYYLSLLYSNIDLPMYQIMVLLLLLYYHSVFFTQDVLFSSVKLSSAFLAKHLQRSLVELQWLAIFITKGLTEGWTRNSTILSPQCPNRLAKYPHKIIISICLFKPFLYVDPHPWPCRSIYKIIATFSNILYFANFE